MREMNVVVFAAQDLQSALSFKQTADMPMAEYLTPRTSDRRKLFEVGFLRGFLGFLAGERAHGGFLRRIPLDSYGGFSLSAGIPTEERARRPRRCRA